MDNEQAEFDRYADEYRAIHAANIRLSGESVDYFSHYKVREVALATADSCSSNPVILDFGAGVCNSTPYFLAEFNAPQLVCADVSHRSLLLGRRAFETQAGFVCFDGSHLPFADQTFEIIFVACVLHHVAHSEHPAILSELRRILQPRGHLFVFEHNPWNPLTRHA
ncbi:MAG: class I SAM-dependent methyltransferase, partial [Planctomycetes bacterium]|nr:class I SAM-dependent methyltransferase [Planctomycetota bacterium]